MINEDFTWKKQAEYADALVNDLVKNGMPVSEIIDMPYHYLIDIMEEKSKPKESKSLISAFGG